MPTGWEYRGAAAQMNGFAEECADFGRKLQNQRYDTGIQGGRLEGDIDTALDASMINAHQAADQCRQLADELTARAIVCDDYAAALALHQQRDRNWREANTAFRRAIDADSGRFPPHPGTRPVPPPTPPSWVSI